MHQIRFLAGTPPHEPAGGAYSAPPDPLAGFKGPTSKGKKGRGRGRKGPKWRRRKGVRKGKVKGEGST